MEDKIKNLKENANKILNEITNTQELEKLRVEYLGKKGEIDEL